MINTLMRKIAMTREINQFFVFLLKLSMTSRYRLSSTTIAPFTDKISHLI